MGSSFLRMRTALSAAATSATARVPLAEVRNRLKAVSPASHPSPEESIGIVAHLRRSRR